MTPGDQPLLRLVRQVIAFGWVSLIGVSLDTGVFLGLVEVGVRPFWASVVGASLAVTFVFFASVRRIFEDRGEFLAAKFAAYVAWQVFLIAAVSVAIEWLVADGGLRPLWAKLATLPVTFGANFVFMKWLTSRARPA